MFVYDELELQGWRGKWAGDQRKYGPEISVNSAVIYAGKGRRVLRALHLPEEGCHAK